MAFAESGVLTADSFKMGDDAAPIKSFGVDYSSPQITQIVMGVFTLCHYFVLKRDALKF